MAIRIRRRSSATPSSLSALGIAGEISLTLGVVGLLFFAWYLGVNDWIQGSNQERSANEVASQWNGDYTDVDPNEVGPQEVQPSRQPPPVIDTVGAGEAFAVLYVPRFGNDYARAIGEGVELAPVLNNPELGVGRYPQSSQFGELGNVAIAGHRTTYGASFGDIAQLRVGDRLYVEVEQGWFSYRFRNHEYVWPTEIDVLAPIPHQPDATPTERLLTLTSCHPRFSEAERIIAYAVFDGWYPREDGPPGEISDVATEVT